MSKSISDIHKVIDNKSPQTYIPGKDNFEPDVNVDQTGLENLDLNNEKKNGTENQDDQEIANLNPINETESRDDQNVDLGHKNEKTDLTENRDYDNQDLIDFDEIVSTVVNKIEVIERSTGENENPDLEKANVNIEENQEGEYKSNACIYVPVEQKGEDVNIPYEQKNVGENKPDHFNDAKSDEDEKRDDEYDSEVYPETKNEQSHKEIICEVEIKEPLYLETKNEQSHEEIIYEVDTKIGECKTELNQRISECDSKVSTLMILLSQKDKQIQDMVQDMFQSLKNENKKYVDNAVSSTQKFYENIDTKISDLKLSFVQKSEMNESLQKSIEDMNQKIATNNEDLDGKIEEIEDQLNDLEGRNEQSDSNLATAMDQLREEIELSVNETTKRLAEDRAAKWQQIIESVKEEAQKIMERIDIVESCEDVLKKEIEENFKTDRKGIEEVISEQSRLKNEMEENNKLNKKMIEEIASEQTINEKIHKAINLNIPEFFEKMKKRIDEVIQKYEIKLDDFKNECNKEQEEFMEKIRIMSEKKMQFYEEEIDRLKNSKRSMKQMLEKKDVEINNLKVNVAQCETLNYRLEQEKTVLESNLKEQEARFYEFDKRYRNKQLSNEEELNRTKDAKIRLERQLNIVKSKKTLYKRWIYFLSTFLIVSIAYIFFVSFDNSSLLYYFTMGQSP
ncbi:hypothetical protein Glove_216g116 [Diversispora epigaea]|uniref:Uncharacterized protein n=1 Tax=Diversispora epigaea TaxID=1348612 RepID=A0A397IQQ3_9GLOM|nr:hypothetical protein Glove_216g116 [Diversispora epigaea]